MLLDIIILHSSMPALPTGKKSHPSKYPTGPPPKLTLSNSYVLKASGAINNGNIDIAELVTSGNTSSKSTSAASYHKFTHITNRKKEIPVFHNKLTNSLLRWITDKMGL